jgi:hypothetical protein
MKAHDIAGRASDLVGGERDRQHGSKVANFENIATLWQAYLDLVGDRRLEGQDVAQMMVMLKIARTFTGEHNDDDFVDECGYAACAGEIAGTIHKAGGWAKVAVSDAPPEENPR